MRAGRKFAAEDHLAELEQDDLGLGDHGN
jgi:hypothetical protein